MTSPTTTTTSRRRTFSCCGRRRFQIRFDSILDLTLDCVTFAVEKFVLILGPVLICFASVIIYGLSWTFFTILLPMIRHKHQDDRFPIIVIAHISMVIFLLVEICFNYFMCVRTPHKGSNYDRVVRELAQATHFAFPETPSEVDSFRRDYEAKMSIRVNKRRQKATQQQQQQQEQQQQQQQSLQMHPDQQSQDDSDQKIPLLNEVSSTSSTVDVKHRKPKQLTTTATTTTANKRITTTTPTTPTPTQLRSWMIMAPDEWGYCPRSKQPKPPRSHYDHVTKTLVLCLDHYCPWMFNAVGYFNYRYFCNFLWFVQVAMVYGAVISFEPFMNSSGPLYKQTAQEYRRTGEWKHIFPMVPINAERMPISLSFMLCFAIGLAVACLGGFHLYLCLTAQTTIEFHGNFSKRRNAKRLNKKWDNPYSLGWRQNFQQIFGTQPVWKAILIPSTREPEFLPLPLAGRKREFYRDPSKMISMSIPKTIVHKEAEIV